MVHRSSHPPICRGELLTLAVVGCTAKRERRSVLPTPDERGLLLDRRGRCLGAERPPLRRIAGGGRGRPASERERLLAARTAAEPLGPATGWLDELLAANRARVRHFVSRPFSSGHFSGKGGRDGSRGSRCRKLRLIPRSDPAPPPRRSISAISFTFTSSNPHPPRCRRGTLGLALAGTPQPSRPGRHRDGDAKPAPTGASARSRPDTRARCSGGAARRSRLQPLPRRCDM
jgi:hypothetical protein